MEYVTVFDIAETGYRTWPVPALGLIFVAIGVVQVFFRDRLPSGWRGKESTRFNRVFSWCWLVFACGWTLIVFVSTYSEYWSLSQAVKSGNVDVVEGLVSQFDPMPWEGHKMERFCVQNECFAYSNYWKTSGFNNATSHGGPIQEGLQVRVTFVRNAIVKLEVAKQ